MPMNRARWNERYDQHPWAFGDAPNRFIAEQLHRLPPGADVVELAAGEGRTAVHAAAQGFRVTAVDYSEVGLARAARLAADRGAALETVRADLVAWAPDRTWDAVLIAFLHVPPEDRARIWALVHRILRPGGWLVGTWFRPAQATDAYPSGGPKSPVVTVPVAELREAFDPAGVVVAEETEADLDEGPFHQGRFAVTRFVWRRPA